MALATNKCFILKIVAWNRNFKDNVVIIQTEHDSAKLRCHLELRMYEDVHTHESHLASLFISS